MDDEATLESYFDESIANVSPSHCLCAVRCSALN